MLNKAIQKEQNNKRQEKGKGKKKKKKKKRTEALLFLFPPGFNFIITFLPSNCSGAGGA